jgi:hypothetical protein
MFEDNDRLVLLQAEKLSQSGGSFRLIVTRKSYPAGSYRRLAQWKDLIDPPVIAVQVAAVISVLI